MSDIPPAALRIGQAPSSAGGRRKGISSSSSSGGKRSSTGIPRDIISIPENVTGPPAPISQNAPCGACKFLRRKCVNSCIFAPHFGSDQGSARFAAVHKVFGASNVSKLLHQLPENRRTDAVITISYEAQARLSDPVYGCVSTIMALQQQVATLQAELGLVQSQLITSRYTVANAIQDTQAMQPNPFAAALTPAYSNASSASNNLMSMNSCNTHNFDLGAEGGTTTAPPYTTFDPVNLSGLPRQDAEEDDEEEISRQYTNQLFHHHHVDRKPYF